MPDWSAVFTAPIDAIERGLEAHTDTFGEPIVGPTDFNRVDYPAAHIIPDTAAYQGQNSGFNHQIFVNHYFRRSGSTPYTDHITDVAETVSNIQTELKSEGLVIEYKPVNVNYFVGADNSGSLVSNIQTEFRVKVAADFGP